ncbi:MAG: RNA polymerase sigma factor [Sedimentisphaerales bacterium]|nr:RNA polymerase sigma factor [Sedimentisphaerales bacterium]
MAKNCEKSSKSQACSEAPADEVTVRTLKQDNIPDFDRIVADNAEAVSTLAGRLLAWPSDVEDIVQDVFLSAYLGLKKFRGNSSIKTWLFKITINKCRNYRRRCMVRLKFFSYARREKVHAADSLSMDSETFNQVRNAIMALPAKYREPVVLKYLQDIPADNICQILGISENVLQVRLSRARQKLRLSLDGLLEE